MFNVRDFQVNTVLPKLCGLFSELSQEGDVFLGKLSGIWVEKGVDPEKVPDVDKATELSQDEYLQLEEELEEIILSLRSSIPTLENKSSLP